MAKTMKLTICHLYPDIMDTYGDHGNIIALTKRAQWRGIETEVKNLSLGEKIKKDFDIYFFGGGQDKAQKIVSADLTKNKSDLKNIAQTGAVILAICGGYQLLLEYFETSQEEKLLGLGIFKGYTKGSAVRMIGNITVEINTTLQKEILGIYKTTVEANELPQVNLKQLVGFENHSGKTYVDGSISVIGSAIKGFGNNGEDKSEGAVYKNAFGCYMHGSLLPKNPHFADLLIYKAMERKYSSFKLEPLNDKLEWQAHISVLKK